MHWITSDWPWTLKGKKVPCIHYISNPRSKFNRFRPKTIHFRDILSRIGNALNDLKTTLHILSAKGWLGMLQMHISCSVVKTQFVNDSLLAYDNSEFTLAVFLDLSKAFDTIDHTLLLKILEHHGMRRLALEWFRGYLSNRMQYVECNKTKQTVLSLVRTGILTLYRFT